MTRPTNNYKYFHLTLLLLPFLFASIECLKSNDNTCNQVVVGTDKIVCKCSENSCHELKFEWPTKPLGVIQVQSSQNGSRFEVVTNGKLAENSPSSSGREHNIVIVMSSPRQTIMGYGGAFTDATGWQLANLSSSMADKLLASYFGPTGLRYTYGRVPLGGSDFSPRAYTYDDLSVGNETDFKLKHFKLQVEDYELKVPFILRAKQMVESLGNQLRLFSSPWSPPTWMKTNKNLTRGYLLDEPQIYEAYANYWINFLDEYKRLGINFWGATIQNEPYSALNSDYFFNSLELEPDQMSKFLTQYLGPKLHRHNYTKENLKLMIGDDNLGMINEPVVEMLARPEVSKYFSGLAYHWYSSGRSVSWDSLLQLLGQIRHKLEFVLMTEACEGFTSTAGGVDLGQWSRAESYASDIIEDLQRYTSGWIDWNMALDEQGAPNWANNFVDSPIIVDTKKNVFYKQPMYYALGHFTRFVLPGSLVVEAKCEGSKPSDLSFVASHKIDTNHVVVVLLSKSSESRVVNLSLQMGADMVHLASVALAAKSVNSVAIKL